MPNETSSGATAISAAPDTLSPRSAALWSLLRQHLSQDLRAWIYSDQWRPAPGHEAADASYREQVRAALREDWEPSPEPSIVPLGGERTLLVIPLEVSPQRTVATLLCRRDSEQHLLSLARLTLDLSSAQRKYDQLLEEFEVCTLQINDDFEELSFLRSIAQQLELSDLSKDLTEMAQSVLPLLRTSIKADEVVLILPEGDDASDYRPALWCGPRRFDESTCRRLAQENGGQAAQIPVVKNYTDASDEAGPYPGVKTFILAAICKGGQQMGWILAANRAYRSGFEDANFLSHLASHEFGTSEAGLVASAASMLASQGRNAELYREREELLIKVVRSLVSAIEAKDPYTCGHSERVALYGMALARRMELTTKQCEKVYLAGLLHDIGKIGISDATLRKPGRLTDEEFDEIKRHPDFGWGILHDLDQLRYVLPGVVHHHERVDGRGYPDGLSGEEIPRDGRILAVADAYDAMTSDRPYRQGMPVEKAFGILQEGAGTQWDAKLVEHFVAAQPEIQRIQQSYQRLQQPVRKAPLAEQHDE